MDILKSVGLAMAVMVGLYVCVILSYIIIPAVIFIFILYAVHILRNIDEV
jgi:hypothetical protein